MQSITASYTHQITERGELSYTKKVMYQFYLKAKFQLNYSVSTQHISNNLTYVTFTTMGETHSIYFNIPN